MFERKKTAGKIYMLPVNAIRPSPFQARTSFAEKELAGLAQSIRENGLLQPVSVRKTDTGYELVAGERRLRACKLAGMETIPAILCEGGDERTAALGLLENIQREDLNPMEEAAGFQALMDGYRLTQEEAAKRVGKSRSAVANALRLLTLDEKVLDMLRAGALTAGHAKAILMLKSEKKQLEAAQKIANLGLSVRQAELLCKNMSKEQPEKKEPAAFQVDYVRECEKSLSKHLGRGVRIVNGKRKGRFELEFYGQDDLQTLLDALMKIQK